MKEYKNDEVFREAHTVSWHTRLIDLYLWVVNKYPDIVMTSTYREGDGIHGTNPLRALDLRGWNLMEPEKVSEDINNNWVYDPKRPKMRTSVYHAVCPKCKTSHDINEGFTAYCRGCARYIGEQWHLHLQVHKNGLKRNG